MGRQVALRQTVWIGVLLPASMALGQYTGTSHPDEVTVTTTDAGIKQPLVYSMAAPVQQAPTLAPADPKERQSGLLPENRTATIPPQFTPLSPSFIADGDPDSAVVTRVEGPANRLPEGTTLRTRLLEHISTRVTSEGAEWKAELIEPVVRDGRVLLPAGAILHGKVTEIHGGKRVSGDALIHLQVFTLTLPDGSSMGIHAQVIDTNLFRSTKVDSEGTIVRRGNHKQQAGVLALTAGSGAAAGAMLGGVPGAVVGAGIGAGVSGALWLKQDRQTDLPRDTELTFELTRSLPMGTE